MRYCLFSTDFSSHVDSNIGSHLSNDKIVIYLNCFCYFLSVFFYLYSLLVSQYDSYHHTNDERLYQVLAKMTKDDNNYFHCIEHHVGVEVLRFFIGQESICTERKHRDLFLDVFSHLTMYQKMFGKNNREFQKFNRRDRIFFIKNVFWIIATFCTRKSGWASLGSPVDSNQSSPKVIKG